MKQDNLISLPVPPETAEAPRSVLEEFIRNGAREMLQRAIELEVADYLAQHQGQRDEQGRQEVVRNGHLPDISQRGGWLPALAPWKCSSPECGTVMVRANSPVRFCRLTCAACPAWMR